MSSNFRTMAKRAKIGRNKIEVAHVHNIAIMALSGERVLELIEVASTADLFEQVQPFNQPNSVLSLANGNSVVSRNLSLNENSIYDGQELTLVWSPSKIGCFRFLCEKKYSANMFSLPFPLNAEETEVWENMPSIHWLHLKIGGHTFPDHMESLSFCNKFNMGLRTVDLPSGLRSLTFGERFNQRLDDRSSREMHVFRVAKSVLPSHLDSLKFGRDFNRSLHGTTLPSALRYLSFGDRFNQKLDDPMLPQHIGKKESKVYYPVDEVATLTVFGEVYYPAHKRAKSSLNFPLKRQLTAFGKSYYPNCLVLPARLQILSFGTDFKQSLVNVTLPRELESLTSSRCRYVNMESNGLADDLDFANEQETLDRTEENIQFMDCRMNSTYGLHTEVWF